MKNIFSILLRIILVAGLCVIAYLFVQVWGESESVIESYDQLTGNSIGATSSIKVAFLQDYVKHTGNTDILITLGVTPAEAELILKDDLVPEEAATPEDDRQVPGEPENSPSSSGSPVPSVAPSSTPSSTPTVKPSVVPSSTPSAIPNTSPSTTPSATPSSTPSASPSATPSSTPSTSTTIPTDLQSLLQMIFACGIKDDSGAANCDKVFKILYPNTSESYSSLRAWSAETENKINQINNESIVEISVNVWQFQNYSPTSTDMTKVSNTMSVKCSSTLEPIVRQIFSEIYNSPEKPVIMSVGGFGVRCMNNGSANKTSTHSYGGTIDINFLAGNQAVLWNWNGGRGTVDKPYPVSKSAWDSLPESQYKHLCLYDGCTIVNTFEKYGLYWGGRWDSGSCDPMHFSVFNH